MNAAKYGALSGQEGHLRVGWDRVPGKGLTVDWQESGTAPGAGSEEGFGSLLVRNAAKQARGTFDPRFDGDRLDITVIIPERSA